jgi:large repetitive protein
MTLLNDLESYWSLDEPSGDAVDAHGDNNLTDNNGVGTAAGIIGNGRDLERDSSQSLSIGDNVSLSFGDESFTVSAWFNLESLPTSGQVFGIVQKWGGTKNEYRLSVGRTFGTPLVQFEISGPTGATFGANFATSLSTGAWFHVVLVHDADLDVVSCIVNNGTPTTGSYAAGVNDSNGAFKLGDGFDGVLDEIGVWRRVLTAAEVASLFNGGNGLSYAAFDPASSSGRLEFSTRCGLLHFRSLGIRDLEFVAEDGVLEFRSRGQ